MLARRLVYFLVLLLSTGVYAQPAAEATLAGLGVVSGGVEEQVKLKLFQNTHHLLQGRADADFGKMKFKSRLFANNEVKFTLSIADEEAPLAFEAYFDLATFAMELDGGGAVLDAEQKKLLAKTADALGKRLHEKYDEIPPHGLMLVQMMAYWSHSPDDYQHHKRLIESSYQ